MQVKNIAKATFGLLAGASLLVPTIAIAGSRYQDQIRAQLVMAARALGMGNYQYQDSHIDRLDDNGEERLHFTLQKGMTYAIVGVCDEDCSDIDLELYDENGNSISADYSSDDYPIVEVTPAWTGQFSLDVDMYSCSADYCYYGVSIFSR